MSRVDVAIVGNAPATADVAARIDGCHHVVRLNKAPGFPGRTGERVDDLALINCGGQMEEWLATRSIEASPAFARARTVVLPIHPAKAELIVPALSAEERRAAEAQDYSQAASSRFARDGKAVTLLPPDFFADSVAALGHVPLTRDAPAPSTGFLLARWWTLRPGTHVHAFDFGFAGWHGHDFAAERAWFARAASAGRLTLHATASLSEAA